MSLNADLSGVDRKHLACEDVNYKATVPFHVPSMILSGHINQSNTFSLTELEAPVKFSDRLLSVCL